MNTSPMASRHHIIRLGFTLSLLAWSFGAVLLGLGNAFIAPVEMAVIDRSPEAHTQPNLTTTTAQHTGSHHHSEAHQSQQDQHSHHKAMATEAVPAADANPGHQSAHHDTTGALPAHCLFCLDGLAPSTLPQINLDTKPALSTADNPGLCKPSVGFCQVVMTPPLRSPPVHQFAQA